MDTKKGRHTISYRTPQPHGLSADIIELITEGNIDKVDWPVNLYILKFIETSSDL